MKDWFRLRFVVPWQTNSKMRREFLETDGWVFDTHFSRLECLWYKHLQWLAHYAKIVIAGLAGRAASRVASYYCLIADRFFGGDRFVKLSATRRDELQKSTARYGELMQQIEAGAWESAATRIHDEMLDNPHIAQPQSKHIN